MVNIDLRRYRLRNVVGPGSGPRRARPVANPKVRDFPPGTGHPSRDIQGLEGRFRQGVNLRVPRSETVRSVRG